MKEDTQQCLLVLSFLTLNRSRRFLPLLLSLSLFSRRLHVARDIKTFSICDTTAIIVYLR